MLSVALEREVDGDLLLSDLGEGLPLRPHSFDGAVSISAVQWLCNADKTGAEPRLRLKARLRPAVLCVPTHPPGQAFFSALYRCLCRGARAVLQLYPSGPEQAEMIASAALRCGFSGGLVVDFPNSTRAKKYFLVLMAGPSATQLPRAQGEGEEKEVCPPACWCARACRSPLLRRRRWMWLRGASGPPRLAPAGARTSTAGAAPSAIRTRRARRGC